MTSSFPQHNREDIEHWKDVCLMLMEHGDEYVAKEVGKKIETVMSFRRAMERYKENSMSFTDVTRLPRMIEALDELADEGVIKTKRKSISKKR